MARTAQLVGRIAGGREQKFDCPLTALYFAVMISAFVDYWIFGKKRHRWRCNHGGKDWKRFHNDSKNRRSKNYVGSSYKDLQAKLEWLHSRQFYLMCGVLGLDESRLLTTLLSLLAGPPLEKRCPKCDQLGEIDAMFGWRKKGKGRGRKIVPQSYCKECR